MLLKIGKSFSNSLVQLSEEEMPKDNLTNLVEEYRNGNVSVFDELYNRTINDMYRYARFLKFFVVGIYHTP